MNRSVFALFVALLLHLLFLLLLIGITNISPSIKKIPPQKRIKISLRELPKVQKKNNPAENKMTPAPLMPKGEQLKKIPTLNPKQKTLKIKQKKTKPLESIKPYLRLTQTKIKKAPPKKSESQMDWLTEDKSAEIKSQNDTKKYQGASAGRNIKKLYGSDFSKLSKGQQKYILDNQEIMRRITQEVLNRQASVSNINGLNVNRSNVIEFFLHPNGDMSHFKFLQQSGYFILDDITKSTIEYAYSKYPRPTEKTLIRYNVFYNLLRY